MLALALKYLKLIKFIIPIIYDIQFNNERENPQHWRITPVHTCAAFLYIVWSVPSILFVFMFLYNCDVVVVQLLSSVWFFETHRLQHGRLHCPCYLPEFAQTHDYWVSDAIQPSHPLLPPSTPALKLSRHHGLSQRVGCSHQVVKTLELQLQYQLFQWIFRTVFL